MNIVEIVGVVVLLVVLWIVVRPKSDATEGHSSIVVDYDYLFTSLHLCVRAFGNFVFNTRCREVLVV